MCTDYHEAWLNACQNVSRKAFSAASTSAQNVQSFKPEIPVPIVPSVSAHGVSACLLGLLILKFGSLVLFIALKLTFLHCSLPFFGIKLKIRQIGQENSRHLHKLHYHLWAKG